MRLVAPVFQLYRTTNDGPVSWRIISPNGRGDGAERGRLRRRPTRLVSPLERVIAAVDQLTATLRTTETFRWRWSLELDGETVVVSAGDLDRRVRCEPRVAPVRPCSRRSPRSHPRP